MGRNSTIAPCGRHVDQRHQPTPWVGARDNGPERTSRGIQTRSGAVPTDFGDGMLAAATALPLPTEEDIPDPLARRKARLETLRAQALVHNLRATALRAGDVCRLTRADPKLAEQADGHLWIEMAEIAFAAHLVFGKDV